MNSTLPSALTSRGGKRDVHVVDQWWRSNKKSDTADGGGGGGGGGGRGSSIYEQGCNKCNDLTHEFSKADWITTLYEDHTHYCLEKVVRRRAPFIKSATAFAVLAVASAPPMVGRPGIAQQWRSTFNDATYM